MINNPANLSNTIDTAQLIHGVPAGVHPKDNRIEFWGDRLTKEVFFNKNGKTKKFTELPITVVEKLKNQYRKDYMAVAHLSSIYPNIYDQLQHYIFCLFGASDTDADFSEGKLNTPENFRCQPGIKCECLKWNTKTITIKGNPLTSREIEVLELIGKGLPDKQIADILKISVSTLNTHKVHLNQKAGVQSKTELIITATKEKAIQ